MGDDGHPALAQRLESSDAAFCAMVDTALGPAAPDARRIVYIDQLEELLLASRDGDAGVARRETFARRICALLDADRRTVLITSPGGAAACAHPDDALQDLHSES